MNSPDRSGITVSARSYTTFWDTIFLEVLERVLTEATGAQIEAFADSVTVTIHVPTSHLLATAQALRDMRLI